MILAMLLAGIGLVFVVDNDDRTSVFMGLLLMLMAMVVLILPMVLL